VSPSYVPDRGDLVWLDFDPQTGREQAGRRPALVLSPAIYNSKAGLAFACPITSKIKGYAFEVAIDTPNIKGVVLSDYLRSMDWVSRNAKPAGAASSEVLAAVSGRLARLLGIQVK
jgi:mRNA interferase MazF